MRLQPVRIAQFRTDPSQFFGQQFVYLPRVTNRPGKDRLSPMGQLLAAPTTAPPMEIGAQILMPRGTGGIGSSILVALGAKPAAPDAPVICVTGDGAFG